MRVKRGSPESIFEGRVNLSRAEELASQNFDSVPEISSNAANAVSSHRKERLAWEVENGLIREKGAGSYPTKYQEPDFNKSTQAGFVTHNGTSSFQKYAQNAFSGSTSAGVGIGSASNGWRGSGSGGSGMQIPELYSPLWLYSNLSLPRDRGTINAWSRSFFALNPLVHNAISLHSTYPISKLNIKSKNRKVENFFAQMIEEIDLMNICTQIAQEFWVLGEAFVYAELDEGKAKWTRLMIQNPDYISVGRNVIAGDPVISLRPDENLKRIINSQKPADIEQRRRLDPAIIEYVKRNQNIPLNNMFVSHLARKISPYEDRGTGLLVSCFRALMLFDRLRESKYAQADGMINPLTLVKIGSQDFKPTPVDLEQWRDVFETGQNNKDFKIFTHNDVTVERVGYGGGIYDISGDITQLLKEILIGLMVPNVIMDGSDTTYGNGSVALDVLRQRYMQFRNMLSAWLRRKIFAPISKLNEFYDRIDGQNVLIVPEVDWNHMSLFDMNDYINSITQLTQGEGVQKKVSLQTLYRSLGLEYEEEQRKIRYEDIQEAIRVKEQASLVRYSLSELRSLGPDDEIQEVAELPVPGESPFVDGQAAGGDGGGGGLGLPPPPGGMGGPPMGGPPKPPGGGAKPPAPPPGGAKPPAP